MLTCVNAEIVLPHAVLENLEIVALQAEHRLLAVEHGRIDLDVVDLDFEGDRRLIGSRRLLRGGVLRDQGSDDQGGHRGTQSKATNHRYHAQSIIIDQPGPGQSAIHDLQCNPQF